MTVNAYSDRRRDVRNEADDVIRWKRPGRVEDNKAWTCDKSASSIAFLTPFDVAPTVGDVLHVRRLEAGNWDVLSDTVRVARVMRISADQMALVGCTVE